jgi:tRNA 2-thiouridine synthesizing protein A
MPTFDKELDATGLTCPMPVMQTKKSLQSLTTGQVLHMIATDPGTKSDIPALVGKTGDQIIESSEADGKFHFYIKKTSEKKS